jgi:hypothetical protein
MESARNRDKVYRALQEALRSDKARTNILKISELGLVEMTRKRTRENLVQQLCEPCSFCEGRGYVLSAGDGRLQAPARDPQGPAALRRATDRGVGLPARGRDAPGPRAPRAGRALRAARREIEVRTRRVCTRSSSRSRRSTGPVGGDPGAVAREPRGARGGRGRAARAAAERRARRLRRGAGASAPQARRPRRASGPASRCRRSLESPRSTRRRSADGPDGARRADRTVDARAPVDGGGEDSILPRLQNSEDS